MLKCHYRNVKSFTNNSHLWLDIGRVIEIVSREIGRNVSNCVELKIERFSPRVIDFQFWRQTTKNHCFPLLLRYRGELLGESPWRISGCCFSSSDEVFSSRRRRREEALRERYTAANTKHPATRTVKTVDTAATIDENPILRALGSVMSEIISPINIRTPMKYIFMIQRSHFKSFVLSVGTDHI